MSKRFQERLSGRAAATTVAVACMGLLATGASAQTLADGGSAIAEAASAAEAQTVAPAVGEPAPRRVTVTAGFEFLSAYLFRGVYQEDQGVIFPPFAEVGVTMYEGSGALSSVAVTGGIWNSLHSGPTGSSGLGSAWYEADYYAGVTFGLGSWESGVTYTAYTSPNDAFSTVNELAFSLTYDDGEGLGLSPSALLAVELDGAATYFEAGISPEVPLVQSARYPLTLSTPVILGLSLQDYYDGPFGNERFGYFSVGALASTPLAVMPAGSGSWEVHGGVNLLFLGDNAKAFNNDERIRPVFSVGLSVSY